MKKIILSLLCVVAHAAGLLAQVNRTTFVKKQSVCSEKNTEVVVMTKAGSFDRNEVASLANEIAKHKKQGKSVKVIYDALTVDFIKHNEEVVDPSFEAISMYPIFPIIKDLQRMLNSIKQNIVYYGHQSRLHDFDVSLVCDMCLQVMNQIIQYDLANSAALVVEQWNMSRRLNRLKNLYACGPWSHALNVISHKVRNDRDIDFKIIEQIVQNLQELQKNYLSCVIKQHLMKKNRHGFVKLDCDVMYVIVPSTDMYYGCDYPYFDEVVTVLHKVGFERKKTASKSWWKAAISCGAVLCGATLLRAKSSSVMFAAGAFTLIVTGVSYLLRSRLKAAQQAAKIDNIFADNAFDGLNSFGCVAGQRSFVDEHKCVVPGFEFTIVDGEDRPEEDCCEEERRKAKNEKYKKLHERKIAAGC